MIQQEKASIKANILVVDDIPANLHLFAKMLSQQGYKVRSAVTGALALSGAKAMPPDLILLDILMPELDGYQVCSLLKADGVTQDIPIIFISALGEEIDKVRAFEVGAVDYITKPFLKSEVFSRIDYHIRAHHNQQKLREQNLRLQEEIEYRRLMETKLERFSFHLKQMHRLNSSHYQTIEALFADYLQTGCSILGCSVGLIGHLEEGGCAIEAIESTMEGFRAGAQQDVKLDLRGTYFDRVIESKGTVTDQSTQSGDRQPLSPLNLGSSVLESFIGTPIWVQGQVYGVLGFGSTDDDRQLARFDTQATEILELMAQSLGKWIGIRQTALKQQQAEEQTQLLLKVTQAISRSPDFETALRSALEHLCEASGWSYGEVWLPNTNSTVLQLSPAWYAHQQESSTVLDYLQNFRLGRQRQTWAKGTGLLGQVWQSGCSEYVLNITEKSRDICQEEELPSRCHIQQGLWIPIRSGSGSQEGEKGTVLAVLVLFLSGISTLPFHHRSHQLMTLAEAIASQLGTVILQKQIEAEQNALLNAMEDLIEVYDTEGACLKCVTNNPQLLIIPADLKIYKRLHQFLPLEEADLHLQAIEQAIATGETQTIEYHLMIDDRRMWFSAQVSPLTEQTTLFVIRDITPLEAATTALQQSEARFRAIFERAGIGIYLTTLDGRFLETNAAFQGFLGYSADEFKQLHYGDVIYPDDVMEGDREFQTLLLGDIKSYQIEKRYYHQDGRVMWGRLTVSAVQENDSIKFIFGMVEDITERHQIQLALQESETRYRELIEVQQDVLVCRWKPNTQLTFVNQYFCQFFHRSSSELIGERLNGFLVNIDDELEIQPKIITLLSTLNPESWEYEYCSGTGETRWLRWTNQPIVDRLGALVDIQSFGVDITAQKQREFAFKLIAQGTASATGNEFFHSCAQYLADILQVDYTFISELIDPLHRRVRVLSFWDGNTRQEMEEFDTMGFPWDHFFSGEEVYYSQQLQEQFRDHPWLKKLQVKSYLGIPLRNTRKEIIGYLSILDKDVFCKDEAKQTILDIFAARAESELERKISEEKLKKIAWQERSISQVLTQMRTTLDLDQILDATTEEIRRVFESDRVAIYQFNSDWSGQFIAESVDLSWEPIVKIDREFKLSPEVITDESCAVKAWIDTPSQRSSSFLPPGRGLGWVSSPSQYLCMPDIYQAGFEITYLKFIETIQARAYLILPIFCAQQLWGLVGIYQNQGSRNWQDDEIQMAIYIANQLGITIQQSQLVYQIKQQSYELQVAKENADAANRAKSSFLAKMSHELRTPLNAILGFSQVMVRDRSISRTQQEQLTIINNSGEHLLALINDVLEMSKIEEGKMILNPTDFDLLNVLEDLQNLLQLKAHLKGLQLQVDVGEDIPQYVYGDRGKLQQVLINLVDNGIKFTNQGSITLHVFLSPSLLRETANKTRIGFTVSDTGIGIAPENLELLFEPFRTRLEINVQHEAEGTGLGLSISKHFVELMGGELTVESTIDVGSSFHFNIPLDRGQPKSVLPDRPMQNIVGLAPEQPTYRILVVDDERDHRLLMMHLLKTVGFEVREVSNGEEAIAVWETWQPHLITMDMRMPVLNGLEATQQIKSTLKGQATVIIALTAHAFQQDQTQVLDAGCDDFLSKPFHEQALLEKIGNYLGVRYLYDTSSVESEVMPIDALNLSLSSAECVTDLDWEQVSTDYLLALHQRSIEADSESILFLSDKISHPGISQWLRNRVDHFEFEQISAAISPILNRDNPD